MTELTESRITWEWIAGFWEAEGTISFHVSENKKSPLGVRLSHGMNIVQVEDALGNTQETFDRIQRFIETYGITPHINIASRNKWVKENWKTAIRLTISGRDNSIKFIEKILPYMIFPQKIIQYENGLKILKMMKKGLHRNKNGFLDIIDLVEKIRSCRTDRGRRVLTRKSMEKYFEEYPPKERQREYVDPLPHSLDDTIIEMYTQRRSMHEIARQLGYSPPSIRNRCISLKIHISERGNWLISDEQKQEIIKLYDDKIPVIEIAEQHNVSDTTIRRILRENNRGLVRKIPPEDIEKIIKRYNKGETASTIAKDYNTSIQTIFYHLKKIKI